jgi:hypothetical protein
MKRPDDGRTHGVKCVTAPGWLGGKRPRRFTRDEAVREAERMNAEDPVEVWEARKLPAA